eukprot:TRINITY_DN1138_c0_g2_i5.p1 TRINITY_DN1138_c0_g2~~TRINITY_DN1138_c0_g2_i5.p1  ORF type:complete len:754 (-),score=81.95 TRINITY_DN1138_c0_g2_i5:223-2484(-)
MPPVPMSMLNTDERAPRHPELGANVWPKDTEVTVLSHHLGRWVTGRTVSPERGGKCTVTYMHEDQMYRKHLRPGAYSISPLAKGNHMHAEAIREATKMHAELDAMPLNPSSKFAVISAHEFANFADSSPGVPAVKDFHGHDKPKKEMQDRHTIIDPWGPREDMAFLGVYDGHAGSVAAEYCKNSLHDILLEEVGRLENPTDLDFAKAFTKTFEQVDETLRAMGVSDGTTATVAVLHHPDPNQPAKVHVANVGDSPAVLFGGTFKNPIAVRASLDHDAKDEKERMRVHAAGGKVIKQNDIEFVEVLSPCSRWLHHLQTTRSLGDFVFKDAAVNSSPVIPTPHVYSHSLEGWESGLAVMSDGVNGFTGGFESDEILVKTIFSSFSRIMELDGTPAEKLACLEGAKQFATDLVWRAYRRRGPTDNMTLIVAFFRSLRGQSSPARRTIFEEVTECDPDWQCAPLFSRKKSTMLEEEYQRMWNLCVIQNDFCDSRHTGEDAMHMTKFVATGNFLKVYQGVYTAGPRTGQDVVLKRFLKDRDQRGLQRKAKIRNVYEDDDWKCEVMASRKAAEVITYFQMQDVYDVPGPVQINLPEIWRFSSTDETGRNPCALVEPFIDGMYRKFNSNNGWFPTPKDNIIDYMQALSHFSYDWSGGALLLCDLQGAFTKDYETGRFVLTDPAIHSKEEGTYGDTDCGLRGQEAFFAYHTCTRWCNRLHDGSYREPMWLIPDEIDLTALMTRTEHTSRAHDTTLICRRRQ